MPASNTRDCFREFIGQRVVGCLFDAFPVHRGHGTSTLVFEDGRGLTISHHLGSYWIESADSVSAAIRREKKRLDTTKRDIKDILALAGAE